MVEFFLGAPAAQFVVSLAFGRGRVAEWAKIVVPLAIVIMELLVASQIRLARMDERADPLASPRGLRLWSVLGALLASAMPLLTFATLWTSRELEGDLQTFPLVLAGAWLIGLAAHFAIVFGGDSAHRARAYIMYRKHRDRLATRVQSARHREQQRRDTVRDAFRLYDEMYDRYENEFGPVPRGVRMMAAEQRLVMQAVEDDLPADFGTDLSTDDPNEDDPVEPATPEDDPSSPRQPPPSTRVEQLAESPESEARSEGEVEYLRALVSQHVRDTDAELAPGAGSSRARTVEGEE
jgi:hypothetical protein